MVKKKISEEDKRMLKLLQNNYAMYEKNIKEAESRGRKESVERLKVAQKEVEMQIKQIDKNASLMPNDEEDIDKEEIVEDTIVAEYSEVEEKEKYTDEKIEEDSDDVDVEQSFSQYDIIPLPSNGEGYKSKVGRLKVAYLTAYDENMITSPNLYKDGLVIDYLLRNKVLTKGFNVDDLLSGDADAIIWFLRSTSYGPDFPITVQDPETGKQIDAVADLSKLKVKEFKLKGDENGYFDFETPVRKDKIKFRYLTRKDERSLEKMRNNENDELKSSLIKETATSIQNYMADDKTITNEERNKFNDFVEDLNKWADKLVVKDGAKFNHMITNRMEKQIVSVNGKKDRKYINDYIKNMPVGDALAFRRYVNENEPGMNFEIEVEKPKNLGGGSIKTFLEWDDTVFLNIS